jgi:hypothetical protein
MLSSASFADLHIVKIDLWVLQQQQQHQQQQQQQQQVFKLDHHKFANGSKHGGRLQICAEKFNEDDKGGVETNYPIIIIIIIIIMKKKENPCYISQFFLIKKTLIYGGRKRNPCFLRRVFI